MSIPDSEAFESLDRRALDNLAGGLHPDSSIRLQATAQCVAFVLAESKGLGHGRRRTLMCRRLKHCPLTGAQRRRLVHCITDRLASGNFSQQFRDQLRLAIHLDTRTTYECAAECLGAPKVYVRRLAAWAINNIEKRAENGLAGNRPIPTPPRGPIPLPPATGNRVHDDQTL